MKEHVRRITRSCFFQLRRLRQIRRSAGPEVMKRLVSALILSRLDYCNAALAGLPQSTIQPLQRAQNSAARLISNSSRYEHITPVLKELHWLPVNLRIKYKLCLLMHLIHTHQCPLYLRTSYHDIQYRKYPINTTTWVPAGLAHIKFRLFCPM